jgi:hypothetical protein
MLPDMLFAKPKRRCVEGERAQALDRRTLEPGKGLLRKPLHLEDIVKAVSSYKGEDWRQLSTARQIGGGKLEGVVMVF